MTILQYLTVIMKKAPLRLIWAISLYVFSGILEVFSLAALIPVLMNLFSMDDSSGFASEWISALRIGDLTLTGALVLVLFLMSMRGIMLFISEYHIAKLARDIEAETRERLYRKILGAEWCYLLTQNIGRLTNVIIQETVQYARAVIQLGNFLSGIVISCILVGASVLVSWKAFLIFIIAVIPYFFIMHFVSFRIKRNAEARINAANDIGAQVGENAAHLKYVKASGMEALMQDKFSRAVKKYAHYFLRIQLYKIFTKNFPEIFGILVLGGLVIYSREYLGENPSDIVFFLLLLYRAYTQIAVIQKMRAELAGNIPSFEICENVISGAAAHQEHFLSPNNVDEEASTYKTLELKKVNFSYHQGDIRTQALSEISLKIPPKGMIAFVGKSGAGKTTLGDILLGLISPDSGEVKINNKKILGDISLQKWRRKIGYVPQDVFLVSGTIRHNILLGAEDDSDENLMRASQLAHVHDFVSGLENGYETEVGDYGIRLSGGQKQRIALARALARHAHILILDEATSALDNETEKTVQAAILEITQTIPVIVIAHRLSTIEKADVIYVMEGGRIVESGTYEELVKYGSAFRRLL